MFNAYPGRIATCPLSSCSNKNDGPRGRFNCISTVSCKGSVCVEVLTSFYGRFFVEEGQFIKYTPSTSSLHLGSHFFHLLTPPRFGALNLPEVNQFTGNCFRMVRIVLKITFFEIKISRQTLDSLSVLGSLDSTKNNEVQKTPGLYPAIFTSRMDNNVYDKL